jgi:YVTN family beta-propeller protein
MRRSVAAMTMLALAYVVAPVATLAQNAYITNAIGNTVSVIDTATNTVTATITVGNSSHGVAVTPDGSKVYVATDAFPNGVSVIDTATTR